MTVITLEQGTPAWIEWRKGKITSTDAPILYGYKIYGKNIESLYKEKRSDGIGHRFVSGAMERGLSLEPDARKKLEEIVGMALPPATISSNDWEFAASSLDCWNNELKIGGEIKCPSIDNHEIALKGSVPLHWMPQIQWQMYCTEVAEWYFVSYNPEHSTPFTHMIIKRDDYMINEIKEKGKYLMYCVQEGLNPINEEWIDDHSRYQKIVQLESFLEQYKYCEEMIKSLKNDLVSTFEDKERARGGNLVFLKVEQEGRIRTKDAENAGIDLSSFRGPPSSYWKITKAT